MFKNIGKKFMVLAKVMFWVMLVSFVVGGIVFIALYASFDSYYYEAPDYYLIIGVVMATVGPLLAWLSSWGIYSWGELVDNVNQIKNAGGVAPAVAPKKAVDVAPSVAPVAPAVSISKPEEIAPAPVVEAPKPVDPRVQKLDMLLANGLITKEEHDRALNNL